ncbi:MAG: hypothetical protein ACM3UP_01465, partial [Methanocella sp.]
MGGALREVNILIEGYTDEAIVKRLLGHVGLSAGNVYGRQGRQYILSNLIKYNSAAEQSPWVVVVDLDHDECAPALVKAALPNRCDQLCLRVAVRAVEAWLLGDAESLSEYLGVSPVLVPKTPDTLPDPKLALVNLARKSRRRAVREDIVPRPNSGAVVGPGYASRIVEFAGSRWRPDIAEISSDS